MRLISLLVLLPLGVAAQDAAVPAPNGQLFDYCITCHGTEAAATSRSMRRASADSAPGTSRTS